MPKGDVTKGRAAFEKFECYYCHEVRGERFPDPVESTPELSQWDAPSMEGLRRIDHESECMVPKVYRESDRKSPMTNFAEKMTVQELIDLSAYIAALSLGAVPSP